MATSRGETSLIEPTEGCQCQPAGTKYSAPVAFGSRTSLAHRWRRRIESNQAKSITDLAAQEGVTVAFVCRLLPLTCLAPDLVEAILDGQQPKGLRLAEMLGNGPVSWEEQRRHWALISGAARTPQL